MATQHHADISSELMDQLNHAKYKDFCVAQGWSLLVSADPMDIMEFIEENGEDADFGDFAAFLADKS